MNGKKFFTRAISLAMILSLSACTGGGAAPESAASSAASSKPASSSASSQTSQSASADEKSFDINMTWFPLWTGMSGEADAPGDLWLKTMGEEAAAQHPGIGSVNVELLTWADGNQKIDTAVMAGAPPDLAYIDMAFAEKYVVQDMLIDVTPYLEAGDSDDFYQNTIDYCSYNGGLYGFPFLIAPRVYYANKTLLEEMGLADKLPLDGDRSWTIDQFKEIASHFPYEKDGKTIYADQVSGGQGPFEHINWCWQMGATLYNDTETEFVFNSPQGVKGITFLQDMVKAGHFRYLSQAEAGLSNGVWSGDTAFGTSTVKTEEGTVTNLAKFFPDTPVDQLPELVAVQFPHDADIGSARVYSGFGGIVMFRTADDSEERRAAVAEFAKYITNTENNKAVANAGCFPTRRSSGDVFSGDINAAVAQSMFDYGEDLGRSAKSNQIFLNLIPPFFDDVLINMADAQTALDSLAAEANAALKE